MLDSAYLRSDHLLGGVIDVTEQLATFQNDYCILVSFSLSLLRSCWFFFLYSWSSKFRESSSCDPPISSLIIVNNQMMPIKVTSPTPIYSTVALSLP